MAGSITIVGGSVSPESGQRSTPTFTLQGSMDVGETLIASLVQGDNTFSVPPGAVGVIVIPAANTQPGTWTLRTNLNAADGGLPISSTQPTPYVFPNIPPTVDAAPTSLIIHTASLVLLPVDLWFW